MIASCHDHWQTWDQTHLTMKSHTQQSTSQPSQPQCPRLVRQAPILPLHTSPPSQPLAQRPNLIRQATAAAPISPPRTSPQQLDEEDEEELGNDVNALEDD